MASESHDCGRKKARGLGFDLEYDCDSLERAAVVKAGQNVAGPVASRLRIIDRRLGVCQYQQHSVLKGNSLVSAGIGDKGINHEISVACVSIGTSRVRRCTYTWPRAGRVSKLRIVLTSGAGILREESRDEGM